jgi:ankyrin repeat protein
MAACIHGKMKYVSELLKSGADATIRSYGGFTAIDWASQKNYTAIIEILQYYL